MKTRISLAVTTASLLLTLSGGVVAQTPQTMGFESHGIAETGAPAANHRDAEASRLGILHVQDFMDFANGVFSELNHLNLLNE